jgi:hypothetical protein
MILVSLDIDGVLYLYNFDRFGRRQKERIKEYHVAHKKMTPTAIDEISAVASVDLFDKEALSNLDQLINLIEEKGEKVGILLHTDWRTKGTMTYLKDLFKQHRFSEKIIDKIPDGSDKVYLVEKWLSAHKDKYGIKDHIILEDQINYQFSKEHLVLCDSNLLFNKDRLKYAVGLLKRTINIQYDEKFVPKEKSAIETTSSEKSKVIDPSSTVPELKEKTLPIQKHISEESIIWPGDVLAGHVVESKNGNVTIKGKVCGGVVK